MKIAVCLSGQPRYVEEGSVSLKGIFPKDAIIDYYGHFWWNPESINRPFRFHCLDTLDFNTLNILYNTYEFKRSIIEPQIDFDTSRYDLENGSQSRDLAEHHKHLFSKEVIFKQLSMYYSICKSFDLIEDYLSYDYIVRSRTDLKFANQIVWDNLDCFWHTDLPYKDFPANGINDTFCIIKPSLLDRVKRLFEEIPIITEYKVIRSHELLLKFLHKYDIPVMQHDWQISIIRNYKYPKHMDTYSKDTPESELPFWFKK
jgi:hypothetical protein